jgi:hypothetical protein
MVLCLRNIVFPDDSVHSDSCGEFTFYMLCAFICCFVSSASVLRDITFHTVAFMIIGVYELTLTNVSNELPLKQWVNILRTTHSLPRPPLSTYHWMSIINSTTYATYNPTERSASCGGM